MERLSFFCDEGKGILTPHQIEFCRKLHLIMNSFHGDADFNAGKLAEYLELSRRQLYREMERIGHTPAPYIREFRMEKAKEHIDSSTVRRVKELAYRVGYKSAETFSDHFYQHFQIRPSELLREVA